MSQDETNPYAPPQAELGPEEVVEKASRDAWREGIFLILRRGCNPPARCIRCNAAVNSQPYTMNLFFFKGMHKNDTVDVSLCPKHRRRREIVISVCSGLLILSVVMIVYSFRVGSAFLFLGLEMLPCVLVISFIATQHLSVVRVEKHTVWLMGASEAYLSSLGPRRPPTDIGETSVTPQADSTENA